MRDLLNLYSVLGTHVVGAEGNISKRTHDGFIIKASGISFNETTEANLVECNNQGNPLPNQKLKPSMESTLHGYIFSNYDINYIAHTHPTSTLKLICTDLINTFATRRLFPDQVIYNGIVSCVVPYATPGIELKNVLERSLTNYINTNNQFPKLILLKNHGIITASKTAKECIFNTQICEKSAEIFLGCIETTSNINFLTRHEINSLINNKDEQYRQTLICQK